MKRLILIPQLIFFLFGQDFSGIWEGPKEDFRFNYAKEGFGPLKIEKDGSGFKAVFLSSYFGRKDLKLYKTEARGNKITITYNSWGHPLFKAELIDDKLIGVLEHHGAVEKLEMSRFTERSSAQILAEAKNITKEFEIPNAAQFRRLLAEKGISAAKLVYKRVKKDYPNQQFLPKRAINSLGYKYISEKKTALAIAVLELNTLEYPSDANGFDSLGEAFFEHGDYKNAEKNLRKSLSLKPIKSTKENSLKLLKEMGISI